MNLRFNADSRVRMRLRAGPRAAPRGGVCGPTGHVYQGRHGYSTPGRILWFALPDFSGGGSCLEVDQVGTSFVLAMLQLFLEWSRGVIVTTTSRLGSE